MIYCNLAELMLLNGDTPKSKHWKTWVLERPMITAIGTVPKGFMTDFASIPAIFRPVFRSTGAPWQRAAVIHDYLYAMTSVDRRFADKAYFWQARMDGTPEWKAYAMYLALRLGAAAAFRSNRKNQARHYGWRMLEENK